MKLYVLVRKDLTKSQQAVQAGHSVAEWLLRSPVSSEWKNSTLVYLSVKDENALLRWKHKLKTENKDCVGFREPYYDNQYTAIASYSDGEEYKKLNLLKL